MQRLQHANVQKCIDELDDFVQAIPSNNFDAQLLKKKRSAQDSLTHLKDLIRVSTLKNLADVEAGPCSNAGCETGVCKQCDDSGGNTNNIFS